ncbi:MAG: heme exporter protein CcmD [Gemmobacter sp.]
MMPDLGKYAVAVLASYGISLGLLAALVAMTFWRGARVKQALRAAEARLGARRDG